MNIIDMRTVMLSSIVSNAICVAVMVSLWFQNRRRSAGMNFWLANFVMYFLAMILIALRGVLPDLISILLSNFLVIGGTILLYIGLGHYTGSRRSQVHNYILLAVFISVHAYFTYVQPSLQMRNINFSLALLAICSQCAWLLLKLTPIEMRHLTKPAGIVLAVYSLVSLVRVFVDWVVPQGNDFFQSGLLETLAVLVFQMLFIGLTFGIFLMVNQQLLSQLENDIVKQRVAEEALKKSEEKFSKAFHNSPDAILISAISDGKIIQVNEGFFRLSGYSRDDIKEKTTINLKLWVNPIHRDQFVKELHNNDRVLNFEAKFRRKTGELFDGFISGELMTLEEVPCALTVIHDISERKQAENELLQIREHLEEVVAERTTTLNERMAEGDLLNRALANLLNDFQAANRGLIKATNQLEASNKELEAFSYSVSHDLRAPLRHISGYVDLLNNQFGGGLPEKAGHYLNMITDATKQMGNLIDDLLQYSKIGRQEIRRLELDMGSLVKEVIKMMEAETKKRKITWTVDDLPRVVGDPILLIQVWTNLLENAVKYTRNKAEAEIEVSCTREAEQWVFSVRDNGAGFDMRYAQKLFGVFQRLHSSAQYEGTGIGLANVQRIILKHEGRVWAEAQLNKGATFYFTIPYDKIPQ